MDKIKKWVKWVLHELVLFLEYPVDYIVEVGDDLKQSTGTDKIKKIAKLIVTIYLCALTVQFIMFFIVVGAVFGANIGYEDDLWFIR